jgi:hypothetical protein
MMSIRIPTIYIAGPMRDIPQYNFPKFDEYAQKLEQAGWVVINPADMDRQVGVASTCPHKFDPDSNNQDQEYMRQALTRDLAAICDHCTAIFMLMGWERSKGAQAEHATATALGLLILYETPEINIEKNT